MKNSTWFITGVSSGFGYEMTKQLLEKGNKVIGTVRNKKKGLRPHGEVLRHLYLRDFGRN